MSVVLRTIEAFPRGRTTEQLSALLGASFNHTKKVALLAELDVLLRDGKVVKGRDGKWRPIKTYVSLATGSQADSGRKSSCHPVRCLSRGACAISSRGAA